MNSPEKALAAALEPVIETVVEIEKRVAELQLKEGPQGERGADGKDADPVVVAEALIEKHADILRGQKGDAGERGADGKDGKDGKDAEPIDPSVVAEKLKSDTEFISAVTPELEVDLDEVVARVKSDEGFVASIRGADGADGMDGVAGRDADPADVHNKLAHDNDFIAQVAGVFFTDLKGDSEFVELCKGERGADGKDSDPMLVAKSLVASDEFLASLLPQLQAEPWVPKIFREGSLVEHYNGRTYKSVCDTAEEPGDSEHWKRVGTHGWRDTGGFEEERKYEAGDFYHKDGSTFYFDGKDARLFSPKPLTKSDLEKSIKSIEKAFQTQLKALAEQQLDLADKIEKGEVALDIHGKLLNLLQPYTDAQEGSPTPIVRFRGDWQYGSSYTRGDVVRYRSALWVATNDLSSTDIFDSFELMGGGVSIAGSGGSGGGGSDADSLPVAGGTMHGALNFDYGGGSGRIEVVDDPVASGKILDIESPDGIALRAPYVVIDSDSPILTMPGAAAGSAVVVAGLNSAGDALLGYAPFPDSTYLEFDVADTNVVIKAAGVAAPSPWVELGLEVTLQEDIARGTGVGSFVVMLQNPTTRTGTVEFGLKVNGLVQPRTLTQAIAANFNSHVAFSAPLPDAYSAGDNIKLVMRVKDNSNNAFSLSMLASLTDLAEFRIAGNISGAVFVSQAKRIDDLEVALDAAKVALGDLTHMNVHGSVAYLLDDLEQRMAALEGLIPPTSEGILKVDNYGGGFLRVRWIQSDNPTLPLLDGAEHNITLALATTDEAGGVHFPTTAELRAMNAGGSWFDNAGSLGKVTGSTGGDVSGNAIAGYIDESRILTVKYDATDPAHAKLIVVKVT